MPFILKKDLLYLLSMLMLSLFLKPVNASITEDNVSDESSIDFACPAPSGLNLISVGLDSAEIGWTTGGATDWQIDWGPVGFTPGSGAMNTNNNPYLISGLDSNVCYDVYVRDSCAPGDVSQWVGPLTFCTISCPNSCIYKLKLRDQIGGWDGSMLRVTMGNLVRDFTLGTNKTEEEFSFPVCDGLNIDLTWVSNATANDNSVSFDLLDPSEQVIFTQGAYPASNLFSFTVNCTTPSCFIPDSLGVTFTTSNSALIYWASGGANDWQIEVKECGQQTRSIPIISPNSNPFFITGLDAGTCYDFFVRDSCGVADVSTWSLPISLITLCDTIYNAPYTETFDGSNWVAEVGFGHENSIIDPCWERTVLPSYTNTWVPRKGVESSLASIVPTFDVNVGASGNYMYLNNGGSVGDSSFFVSPQVDLNSLTSPELQFWYHRYELNASDLDVEISNNNGLSWSSSVFSLSGQTQTSINSSWLEARVDLSTYTNDTIQVRFKATSVINACCGNQSIDNISIVEKCVAPSSLQVDSVGTWFANVSWLSSNSNFEIEYDTVGFILGSGTNVSNSSINNEYFIKGLMPNTCYDVYIRDSCAASGNSVWVGPLSFCTTTCTTPSVIFSVIPPLPAPGQTTFSFDATGTIADSLFWDFDDGNTNPNGSLMETHTYTSASNGGVVVKLTACNKCTETIDSCRTTSRSILINGIGTQEYLLSNIEIYPNPNNGEGVVVLKDNYKEVEVSIVNSIGQVVSSNTYNNVEQFDFKISSSPGLYSVHIVLDKHSSIVFKVLKN